MDVSSLEIDRSKYDNAVLNTCEILSTYFVNFYYNDAYYRMNDIKMNKNVDSLTDAYRNCIQVYYANLSKPEFYKRVIEGIHNLYTNATGISTLSFRECIHRIGQQFAAKDSYDGFSDSQRQGLVRKVIMDVNKMFIDHIFRKRLHIIIDHHKEKTNGEALKQEFIDMLLLEREKLLNEYYSVVIGGKSQGMMTLEVGDRLKQMLTLAVKEKIIALKKCEQWQKAAEEYKAKYEDLLQKSNVNNAKTNNNDESSGEIVSNETESDNIETSPIASPIASPQASPLASPISTPHVSKVPTSALPTSAPILSLGHKSPITKSPTSTPLIKSPVASKMSSNQTLKLADDDIQDAFKDDDDSEDNIFEDVSDSEPDSEPDFVEEQPPQKAKKESSKPKKKNLEDFDQFDDFLDEKPVKAVDKKESKKKESKKSDEDSIFDDFEEKPKKEKSKKDKKDVFDEFTDDEQPKKEKKSKTEDTKKKSKKDEDKPSKKDEDKSKKDDDKPKKEDKKTAVAPMLKSRGITLSKK